MIICDSRKGCPEADFCGGAKPHRSSGCEPCPFNKEAKCKSLEIEDCGLEESGWCKFDGHCDHQLKTGQGVGCELSL